jgi:hypothetical protein
VLNEILPCILLSEKCFCFKNPIHNVQEQTRLADKVPLDYYQEDNKNPCKQRVEVEVTVPQRPPVYLCGSGRTGKYSEKYFFRSLFIGAIGNRHRPLTSIMPEF